MSDKRVLTNVIGGERAAAADGSWPARWRATVEARLPDTRWPDRAVLITAVDARSGEPAVFDRHSGVDLVDAVARGGTLDRYHLLHAVRADLLARLGRGAEARSEFLRAAELTENAAERALMRARAESS